jgi:enterochelin esterase-like enzyme
VGVTVCDGPQVGDGVVDFTVTDRSLKTVALLHELERPRRIEFARARQSFTLRYPRPAVDRFEYLLELTTRARARRVVPDPTNPLRAPGPFGDKSVVEFPEYEAPEWTLDGQAPAGDLRELTLESVRLRTTIRTLLWSPEDADPERPLPLLVVHDGPDYGEYARLLRLLAHLVEYGETPEFRALLLPPGKTRDELYSASARYASALAADLIPHARTHAAFDRPPVLLGASLGALAALHAHVRHPGLLGGLFLQSGSFFRRRYDSHESGFGRFGRIARFVGEVHGRSVFAPAVPTVVTCGTGEENLANNRALAAALERRGWDVHTVWNRDAHNWTAWRDVLHPHLATLLLRAWT